MIRNRKVRALLAAAAAVATTATMVVTSLEGPATSVARGHAQRPASTRSAR